MGGATKKEPLRILQMIGSLEVGGSQSMIINLHKAIDRTKVQFDYIIDHPQLIDLLPVVEELGAKVYVMPTFRGINLLKVIEAWNVFFMEHPEYKVLHSHVRSYASIYLPIAKKYGVKTIIHSHSTSNGSGITALVKAMLQFPLRYQADYFFSCSKEAGEWLFGKKVVNGKKHYILKNSIDLSKYTFDVNLRNVYRSKLNISNKTVYIHVGRLHEAKNHMFLLDVFSELCNYNKDAVLLVVGDGPLHDTIAERSTELELQDKIWMLGTRDDVANLLLAADCFLFPSLWEGLPVTVVEAQATGLPCFISNTITQEVRISPLVKELPIDKGTQIWLEAIQKSDLARKDVTEDIKNAGFDVQSAVEWLSGFYFDIINN